MIFSDAYSQSTLGMGNLAPPAAPSGAALAREWSHLIESSQNGVPNLGALASTLKGNATKSLSPQVISVRPGSPFVMTATGSLISSPGGSFAFNQEADFSLAQVQGEMQRSAQRSEQQLKNDVAQLDAQNRAIAANNDRVGLILGEATGAGLAPDPDAWQRWYVNLLGYAFAQDQSEPNPTFVQVIPSDYQPELTPFNVTTRAASYNIVDCFAAGTPVQTITGPQPIERLKVGDLVLTQDTTSGGLGYKAVTVAHHNPPAPTYQVRMAGGVIACSQFHRVWVARRGWVMARDLKPGDPIRTLGGVRAVESVEVGPVEPVFNLDIADDADFFAGASAALVYDNTLPDPRLVPFDRPSDAAKAVAAR